MNRYTREIMAMFGANLKIAGMIQIQMERDGIDYSECTAKEFRRAAREAARALGYNFETIRVVAP